MNTLRIPAVAGQFYPDDGDELRQTVINLLAQAKPAHDWPCPKALIVPHAGYVYSGAVAASAYVQIQPWRDQITRVVLLGPAHRVGFQGLAIPSAEGFLTPLGKVSVDHQALALLSELGQVHTLDQAHALEHSLEVQLPFLQQLLGEFRLVPLVVGDAGVTEVSEVLERLWGGAETLIVISTDLSHYLDYASAVQRDAVSSAAIERLDGDAIGYEDACGRNPLRGLLYLAKQRQMQIQTLDLRNSGDTAGPRGRVVGYGAYALFERAGGEKITP